MPDQDRESRRMQERIKRRTTRLDGLFAFDAGGRRIDDSEPLYSRGEAELRASTVLSPLPALPPIVMEASRPDGPGTAGLEKAIDADPGLAALTLGLSDTTFFRRGTDAPQNLLAVIERVGTTGFRSMTIVGFFRKLFADPLPWYGYEEFGLWRHLVAVGIAAWRLAEKLGFDPAGCDNFFFGALLHDIGKPTIQALMTEQAPTAQEASLRGQLTILEAERRTVNMTHAELVPLILDIWGVEHAVFRVAEHHHAPQRAGDKSFQAYLLQLADVVANQAGIGGLGDYGFSLPPLERVAKRLALPVAFCAALAGELGWLVSEIAVEMEKHQ